jgi:Tol biopolymer transport system component
LRSPGSAPIYSIDGQKLFFVREIDGRPNVVNGDKTGDAIAPFYVSDQAILEIDIPVDNNFIAAVHQANYNGNCIPFEPRLMSITPRIKVADVFNINADSVAISPDRRWLAYAYRVYCDAVGTVLYDSNRLCLKDTAAVSNPLVTCQSPANYQGMDFGNTSSVIVFSANYGGQNEIWRTTVTQQGGLADFVQLTRGQPGQPATQPRLSSDGNWVAFLRDVDAGTGENLQVHVVRADGDNARSLGFSAKNIAWSGGGPSGPVIVPNLSKRAFLPMVMKQFAIPASHPFAQI